MSSLPVRIVKTILSIPLPLGTNAVGAILFFGGFGISAGIGMLARAAEGPMTIVGGLLVGGSDVAYRLWLTKCGLLDRERGGTFLFIPIWMFGVFWVALGIAYLVWG
jgi:hypothetical protein